jgi:thymidylate synthase ThyX
MIKVELQESMGSDAAIANAAWTSTYDKARREDKYDAPEKVATIVRRMARDGHSVPFESVVFRFWNLRSFANYIRLRRSSHAQPEIFEVADAMLKAVHKAAVCPVAMMALEDAGWRI